MQVLNRAKLCSSPIFLLILQLHAVGFFFLPLYRFKIRKSKRTVLEGDLQTYLMPATKCLKYCQCGVNLNHSSINHSERKQVFYRTQLAATVLVFQDKICHKARRQPSYHGNKQSAVNHSCLSFSLAGHRLNRIYIILYLVLSNSASIFF